MLRIEGTHFKDASDRSVFLRGINFTADVKQPVQPGQSYVNTPCSPAEIAEHLERLRYLGFNCLRFVYTWDALQPEHPDKFDEAYIDFAIDVLRLAVKYGFYIFMDAHQDIWSRFSGGSGAPLWTLHAAGFDERYFSETDAAYMWDPEAKHHIKMQWASNYHRLVCQTMFTLFFAGPEYAPKVEINGVNVGTYLKGKFFDALRHFMERVDAADLGPQILGWESINEPGHGLIGYEHLNEFPKLRTHVKLGTAPTPFQAMLLGQGIAQSVEMYKFTSFGLRKVGENKLVSPSRGTWLKPDDLAELDAKYGWERSWPGGCIWELHGIYDSQTKELKQPNYFRSQTVSWELSDSSMSDASVSSRASGTAEKRRLRRTVTRDDTKGAHLFVDKYYVNHWKEFTDVVRGINPNWFHFMQAPVNTPPPYMSKLYPGLIDPERTVYTPHFYDGLTLLLKRWRWLNVDAIGVMRDLYSNPLPALRFGDASICKSFYDQFLYLKEEGIHRIGDVPMVMSEIGIPYDMDKKNAFTSGYWDNQIRAMDANLHALEKAKIHFCVWCYAVNNTHKYGDNFAGEDLSIWSADDLKPELEGRPENGIRAAAAVVRPTPVYIAGIVDRVHFDLRKAYFFLTVTPNIDDATVVYVPEYHFPDLRHMANIETTHGHVKVEGQILTWYHDGQLGVPQTLYVRGSPRFRDALYSYFEGIHRGAQVFARQIVIGAHKISGNSYEHW